MAESILSVIGVSKFFGGVTALKDISFDVYEGEILGLMGPNGAGKTTLLNVISGEHRPETGRIKFKGKDITGMSPHRVCHLGIARTYQIPQPYVGLTVRDNLLVSATYGRQLKMKEAEIEDEEILKLVGLKGKGDVIAGNLPILSLKRLELARALARKPELILLDEIAAGTRETEIPDILRIIKTIRDRGITIIIIEHVMRVLMNVVDRIVVIDKGSMIAEGSPSAIMCDTKVIEAYFGT